MRKTLRLSALLLLMAGCGIPASRLGVEDPLVRAMLRTSTIAYSTEKGVYLARGDGTRPRRIVKARALGENSAVFMPSVSPDARRLFFLSLIDVNRVDSTGRDLTLSIMDIEGGAVSRWLRVRLEKIVDSSADGRQAVAAIAAARWSPDGGRIALGVNRERDGAGDAVMIFDAEGKPLHSFDLGDWRLPRLGGISWSIDGQSLFVGLEGGVDPVRGTIARLRLDPEEYFGISPLDVIGTGRQPTMSPDGKQIAVIEFHDGQWDIVLMDPEGRVIDRFDKPAGRALNRPFWSPDGRFLYFYSLASTGPLGLIQISILRCLDTREGRVFDLVRIK